MAERLSNEEWEEDTKAFYGRNAKLYAEMFLANEENRELVLEEIKLRREEFPESIMIRTE